MVEIRHLKLPKDFDCSQLIRMLKAVFLDNNAGPSFAGHSVAMLVSPSLCVPASVHFLYYPPGYDQPVHQHTGGRVLLCVNSAKMNVCLAEEGGPSLLTAERMKTVQVDENSAFSLSIPPNHWHKFSVQDGFEGGIVFSFHPSDLNDEGVKFDEIQLMERLTTFIIP